MSMPDEPQPFLDEEPPPWAMRALALVLLLLFLTAGVALFAVQVPESVAASFVLEPVRGADPIRALYPGTVTEVNVVEAQVVSGGDRLFVLSSELVGDRMSERQMVDARLSGGRDRLVNERLKFENQQRGDGQEQRRLEQRLVTLQRQADLKSQELRLTEDIASRRRREFDEGLLSLMDANRARLDVDRLAASSRRG
jgi:multidrug efflux pump subunit AcrA (membrane-fusion protein)